MSDVITTRRSIRAAGSEYVSLAEAARILGRETNPSAVKSIALAGGIRTRAVPGCRVLYSRQDAERLASSG
jgi:hypothetical protein